MRRLCLILLLAFLVSAASGLKALPVRAQTTSLPIKPGEPITGEFKQGVSEIRYTFDGKKDTYITIVSAVIDRDNNKLNRSISLLDSNGKQRATQRLNSFRGIPIRDLLPADGAYTIVVGPSPNADPTPENGVGRFQVRLDVASVLEPGNSVTNTVSTNAEGFDHMPAYLISAASGLTMHVTSQAPTAPDKPLAFSVYIARLQGPQSDQPIQPVELARLDVAEDWAGDVTATLPADTALYLIHVDPAQGASAEKSRAFTLVVDQTGK